MIYFFHKMGFIEKHDYNKGYNTLLETNKYFKMTN